MTKETKETEALQFEEAIAELERIVGMLESGDVPLEKAIELFQKGMQLSHLCSQKLDHVERKIEALIENVNGSFTRKPFEPAGEEKGELL